MVELLDPSLQDLDILSDFAPSAATDSLAFPGRICAGIRMADTGFLEPVSAIRIRRAHGFFWDA
jgi:hypothetical protein